jgi:enamine deaminase RidA (YjgF/YER057c/UK114 family)
MYEGKLGRDLTVEQGAAAARQTAINLLTVLKHHIGDLDRIKQIVKVLGWVNSTDEFADQPSVINGASLFLEEVFGERGKHARSAIGTNSLPFNTPVEIEMIVELESE